MAAALSLGRRLDVALLALQLAPQGTAVDYSREVVSSTPTKTQEPPRPDLDADGWCDRVEQLVVALERLVDGESLCPELSTSALKVAVRPHAGHAAGFVAYALGTSTERVMAVRAVLDVDSETGLAKPKAYTSRELPC